MPTAGIGFYYQRPGFYASLSAPSLLLGSVNQNNILSVSSPTLKNMQVVFTTGVTGQLGEQFQVKPSVYLKWMNGQVFEIHLNASIWVADMVGLGASYRADDAVLGILELKINDKLSFGYTYGKNIGNKSVLPQPSHEAMIRLDLWRSDE
jgi:type IX secretion system PorP/SprF family membrane protein